MQSLEAIVHWNIVLTLKAHIKNHIKLDDALFSDKIESCKFLSNNHVIAQSLLDFVKLVKGQKINDILCYVGSDADLKTMSNPVVYEEKGSLYVLLVYENHSSFWKMSISQGEHLSNVCYHYVGKTDIALKAMQSNIASLKKDIGQLYEDALEEYKSMPETLFFDDSRNYILQCFEDALEQIQTDPRAVDSTFWCPELVSDDVYQVLSSLRKIPLVHRMGSFLDMHSTIAPAHGKLYNKQNLILQQCINA
ncbi:hypothetical protein MRY82_03235 [bacterium]|nr:hypothetical protein [bacterium]